jgi:hypothetical protein
METTDAYEILGVPRGATQEQIRRAYLRLSRQVHSDTGGSDGLFRQVKWAYDTLAEPPASARFDPPHGEEAEGPHPYHEDVPPDQAEKTGEPSSPLRVWLRANPSLALFLFGIAAFILGVRSGASASLVTLAGAITFLLGLAGLMGAKRTAEGTRPKAGAALLKSQLKAGIPQLLKKLGIAFLLLLAALMALGFTIDHSGKKRRRT